MAVKPPPSVAPESLVTQPKPHPPPGLSVIDWSAPATSIQPPPTEVRASAAAQGDSERAVRVIAPPQFCPSWLREKSQKSLLLPGDLA